VDIRELVTVVGKDVRLLDRQSMQDSCADRLGESPEIGGVTLPSGVASLRNEVRGIGKEGPVVVAEVFATHVPVPASALQEGIQISSGPAAIRLEVGVQMSNFDLELSPSGGSVSEDVRVQAGNVLPGFSCATGVTLSPVNHLCVV
jgi:hypothetical protein